MKLTPKQRREYKAELSNKIVNALWLADNDIAIKVYDIIDKIVKYKYDKILIGMIETIRGR